MTTTDDTPRSNPPTEFGAFLRRLGINAFDQYAQRRLESRLPGERGPLNKLATLWLDMSLTEKARFFDQLIAAGQSVAAAAPVMIAMAKTKKKSSAEHAYDAPSPEVEKPKEKKVAKAKDKKERKQKKADTEKEGKSTRGKKAKKETGRPKRRKE